jgi:hypothetical protein
MTLMTLVRSIGAVAIVWALVAIGIGASGTRLPAPEASALLPAEPPTVDVIPKDWPIGDRYDLMDLTNGEKTPIRLPAGKKWSNVGVSPWRGPGGELEAAGRWIAPEGEVFCGWGLFRLSDGAVLCRIATEILPMGRPCWVPGHARTIVFPAGDGQLYWCRLARGDEEPVIRRPSVYATGRSEPSEPVVWEVRPPGSGEVFLDNPVWSHEPRLKKWIFVGLRQKEPRGDRLCFGPPRLWWLETSDDARSIVAAGRLTGTVGDDTASGVVEEHYPNVAVRADGGIRVVYVERSTGEKAWRLRSVGLGFDPTTGRPMAVAGGDGPTDEPREALQAAPLLVSTDGATVYGLSRTGGLASLTVGRSGGVAQPRQRQE